MKGLERKHMRKKRALGSHAVPAAVGQLGLHAAEAPVQEVLPCSGPGDRQVGEVPGPARPGHLHCNKNTEDLMDSGSKCVDEHINHITSTVKKIEGLLFLIHRGMRNFAYGH